MIPMMMILSFAADARDTIVRVAIEEAMTTEDAKVRLDVGVRFFFADQEHPEVVTRIGTYTSNKKTNAFNKSDQEACKWAFLSAMTSLQDRADLRRVQRVPVQDQMRLRPKEPVDIIDQVAGDLCHPMTVRHAPQPRDLDAPR